MYKFINFCTEVWLKIIINNMMEHKSTGFIKHTPLAKTNRNGLKKKDAELGRGPSESSSRSPIKFSSCHWIRNWVSQLYSLLTVFFFGVSKQSISLQQILPMCPWRKLIGHKIWNCTLAHRQLLHSDLPLNFFQRWVGRIWEATSRKKNKKKHNSRSPPFQNPGCWEKGTASLGFSL